jgi:predicted nucleic acid-binding protein
VDPNPPKSAFKKFDKIISKKDIPILAGAIQCDYLITLDNEFLNEKVIGVALSKNLEILRPKNFIQLFK